MFWNLLGQVTKVPQASISAATEPEMSTANQPAPQAPAPKSSEDEALEKLLSFEKKIMNSTPPQNTNSKKGQDEGSKDVPPEVLRARNALKLGNPFRGV